MENSSVETKEERRARKKALKAKRRLKEPNTETKKEEKNAIIANSATGNVFRTADGTSFVFTDKKKKKGKKKIQQTEGVENIENGNTMEEDKESKPKKAKFDIKLTTSSNKSKQESESLLDKKGPGPKIIIAQENSELVATNDNSKKRKKKTNDDSIHETKGYNKSMEYLHSWKSDRSAWKFEKSRQNWLVMHAYDDRISKEDFEILLDYLKSIRGGMREVTKKNAKAQVKKLAVDDEVQDTDGNTLIKEKAKKILKALADPQE